MYDGRKNGNHLKKHLKKEEKMQRLHFLLYFMSCKNGSSGRIFPNVPASDQFGHNLLMFFGADRIQHIGCGIDKAYHRRY